MPHITLKSIANDETPPMEVLVDRPETNDNVIRVSGPFVVEATIAPGRRLTAVGVKRAAERPAQPYADPATHLRTHDAGAASVEDAATCRATVNWYWPTSAAPPTAT